MYCDQAHRFDVKTKGENISEVLQEMLYIVFDSQNSYKWWIQNSDLAGSVYYEYALCTTFLALYRCLTKESSFQKGQADTFPVPLAKCN